MMGLRKANKVFAVLLLIVMFLTNPICIGPLYAASLEAKETTNSEGQIELDSKTKVMSSTETAKLNSSDLTDSQRFNQFVNRMIPYYLKGGKKNGPDWLRTTDVKFSFTEDYKPEFSFTTVQPFFQANDKGEMLFWQGRFAHQSDTNTANLGVGWRKLSSDKQQMVGFNLFYDYGFKYDLSRVGTGVEYFNKLAEYRANFYMPTSGDRQTGVTYSNDGILYSYIRAVQGLDYEVGTSFENARWLSVYASGYFYDNKYHDNEVGYKLRSVMQLTPRFSAELGYDKSNLTNGGLYGKVAYQLADRLGPSLSGGNKEQAGKPIDLTYKLLQKVERNNTIKTETFTKFVSYIGSIQVSVTNTSGASIIGAQVQAYQNGSPVGSSVTTDSSGNAIISGLNVGTYTVKASYYNYSDYSNPITVTKDQSVNASVTLPVIGGKAVVNVINTQYQGIGGASVTATMVSTTTAKAQGSFFDRILGVKTAYAATSTFSVTVAADANGVATFSNLPPGTYTFMVTSNSMSMTSSQMSVVSGGIGTTTVMLSASGGNVNVIVKDNSGTVLDAATVRLSSSSVQVSKTTGSDGIAILGGLAAGMYTLSVSKNGYTSYTDNVTVSSGDTTERTVTLTAETGSASITVNDGTNVLQDAIVTVMVNGVTKTANTDSSGVATFTNLPVGNYTFSTTKIGYSTVSSGSVTIASGQTATTTISVALLVGSASITINDGSTNLSGATVSVTVNGSTRTVISDNFGVASFSNLPVGSYTFSATKLGYSTVNSGTLTITNATVVAATISLAAQGGNVAIAVSTSDGGTVVPSFTVDGVAKTATNIGNVYTLSGITAGTHTIIVSAGAGYTSKTLNDVNVTNGATTSSSITLPAIPGSIAITVHTNDSGMVTPNFTVDGVSVTATSSGSVYTLSNIAAGNHIITVGGIGYTTGTLSGVSVTNNTVTSTSITLVRETGSVAITVNTNDLDVITPIFTVDGVAKMATSAGNVYTLSDIATGNHTIMVAGNGYTTVTLTNVSITKNATTVESITLVAVIVGGSVAITIGTSDNGAVAPSFMVDGVATAATSSGSVYTLSGIGVGTHTITISSSGYTTGTLNGLVVVNKKTTSTSITLTAIPGSVAITVNTNDSGTVTPSFKVDGVTQNATKAGNVYTLSGIAAGSHTISVEGTGYATGTLTGVSVINDTTTTQNITLAAIPGSVAITVNTSDSEALTPSFMVDGVTKTATQAGNVYTLSNIVAGSHTIAVAGAGYMTGTLSVSVMNATTTTQNITLAAIPGSVAITVNTSDSGAVTPSFMVDGVTKTATQAGNVYTLSNIVAGSHTITVVGPGYTTGTLLAVSVINATTTTQNITLVAIPGSVAVTVNTSDSGAVKPNFTVDGTTVVATSSGSTASGTVYTLSNIAAGSHIITVSGAGYTTGTLSGVSVTNNTITTQTITLVQSFEITASAGSGGTITPSGMTTVSYNGSQSYTITANTGYTISSIIVDGSPVTVTGSPQTYTFSNVTGAHSIAATFVVQTFAITASVTNGTGGTITPSGGSAISTSGTTNVAYNDNQIYTISADTGYIISSIIVDGYAQPVNGSWQTFIFSHVTGPHTITVTFVVPAITVILNDADNVMLWNGGSVGNVPISARLNNFQGPVAATVSTDSNGKAVFIGLAPGTYVFTFKTDYDAGPDNPMYSNDVIVIAGQSQTITIPTGGY